MALTTDTSKAILRGLCPHERLVKFARAMLEADMLGNEDANDLLDFLEKPWKWADEFTAWVEHGEPTGGDDAGWDDFLAIGEEV